MYGKTPKMMKPKAPAAKKPVMPKLPVRGQRMMTNKMTRGKK
jgi:hypothetical protein